MILKLQEQYKTRRGDTVVVSNIPCGGSELTKATVVIIKSTINRDIGMVYQVSMSGACAMESSLDVIKPVKLRVVDLEDVFTISNKCGLFRVKKYMNSYIVVNVENGAAISQLCINPIDKTSKYLTFDVQSYLDTLNEHLEMPNQYNLVDIGILKFVPTR